METLPIIKPMTDNADGTYHVEYSIPQDGTVTVSIVLASQGGLYAEYFNNAFLDGVPALSRIDSSMDFDWGQGLITE